MADLFNFKKDDILKEPESQRPFSRINFMMMGGFLLMSGGGSSDQVAFDPEVFSTRRIVVGPALTFLGFLLMAFAIIYTPGRRSAKGEKAEVSPEDKAGK